MARCYRCKQGGLRWEQDGDHVVLMTADKVFKHVCGKTQRGEALKVESDEFQFDSLPHPYPGASFRKTGG